MHLKYKLFTNAMLSAVLLLGTVFALTFRAPQVQADPVASCGDGATLMPAQGDKPAYCSCPNGKVLVTGATNTCADKCPDGTSAKIDDSTQQTTCNSNNANNAENQETIVDPALNQNSTCTDAASCDLVTKYVNPAINLLAALVGVAVTISLIIGGIQYGSSGGDPQAVTAAKNRIRNAIVALLVFIFLYALLNFLIPGGLI